MFHFNKSMKKNYEISLQRKTMLMLFGLLLFFGMMFMLATTMISKKTDEDYKQRTSETAVNNVASSVKASMINYNYLTRQIMVNERVVRFLKADIIDNDKIYEARRGIYEIQKFYNNVDSVYLFRNDGAYVSTGQGQYTIDINDDEYQRILDARGATVVSINGNGSIIKNNAVPLLTTARAIYDINSQKLMGIMIMNISNYVFDDVMSLQNSSGMCIVDKNGTYLCGSKVVASLYDDCFYNEKLICKKIVFNNDNKTLTGTIAADPLVVLCASGKGAGALPMETVYSLMITLSAFILSTMVCAWFITINIARPIKKLSDAMERTKSSGWLEKIDTEMPDNEIGRLATSYNSMIEYLNELFNRLLENEKNVQKVEMRVLQEQIKPHFLYNSLDTISYMALQENAGRVHDALEILGDFYRNFLSKGDREIPLKRELRITQDYLSLQKMRYGNIFNDEYDLDEASLECMIPKLILQPLVENCIYHGVRLKGEMCIIRITTRILQDGLHIIVYDSGVGMSQEQIKNVLVQSEEEKADALSGFGLRGTINRIRYYCDCENAVQIRSESGEYTEIEIYIPTVRKMDLEGEENVSSHDY